MVMYGPAWPRALPRILAVCLLLLATQTVPSACASPQNRREKEGGTRGEGGVRDKEQDTLVTSHDSLRRVANRGRQPVWEQDGGKDSPDPGDGARVRLAAVGRLEGSGDGTSELCDSARLQCTVRTGCQMALNNFFIGCNSIITGEESTCTTACQHALVSLLATEDEAGLAFINCNCSGHVLCEERKQRVQVCQRHVLASMDLVRDDAATVSCGFARWICEADTSCLAALQYYVLHCAKLFQGTKCSARCRNSVHILYRQPNARKLRTCRCEGDEDYDCARLVANTEKLCFQRPHRHGHQAHQHLHNHHDNGDNSQESHLPHDDFSDDYLYDVDNHTGTGPATLDRQRQTSGDMSQHSSLSGHTSNETTKRRKRRNKPRKGNNNNNNNNNDKKKKKKKKRKKKELTAFPWNAMLRDQQHRVTGVKVKNRRSRSEISRSRGRKKRRRSCPEGRKKRRRRGAGDRDKDKDEGKARDGDSSDRKKCLLRSRKGLGSKRDRKVRHATDSMESWAGWMRPLK